MQHKGTVRLETDRLILRRFRLDDSGAAFQNWTSDKRVTEFLRWPAQYDKEDHPNVGGRLRPGRLLPMGDRFEKQRKWTRRYDQRC